jgi:hypothetical protein
MPFVDPSQLQTRANSDPEFIRAARYWNATLSLETPGHALCVDIEAGEITRCRAGAPGEPATITVTASEAGWQQFLAPVPRPFYQDLLGGCVQHHGFTVAGDLLALSAYYQASQRLFAIMRALRAAREGDLHGAL